MRFCSSEVQLDYGVLFNAVYLPLEELWPSIWITSAQRCFLLVKVLDRYFGKLKLRVLESYTYSTVKDSLVVVSLWFFKM